MIRKPGPVLRAFGGSSESPFDGPFDNPTRISDRVLEVSDDILKDQDTLVEVNLSDKISYSSHRTSSCYSDGLDREKSPAQTLLSATHRIKLWLCLVTLAFMCFQIGVTSSMLTNSELVRQHHLSPFHSTLGVSLFFGAASIGSFVLSTLADYVSGQLLFVAAIFFYVVMQLPIVFGQIAAILVGRVFVGLAASVLLSWSLEAIVREFGERTTTPLAIFNMHFLVGFMFGPIFSELVTARLGFAWTLRITLFWALAVSLLVLVVAAELRQPFLTATKKSRMDEARHYSDTCEQPSRNNFAWYWFVRPFALLRDPVLLFLIFVAGYCLSIVNLFFVVLPIDFSSAFKTTLRLDHMMYLGAIVGVLVGGLIQPMWNRLSLWIPMIAGSAVLPLALLIIAWTDSEDVPRIVPCIGTTLLGFSIISMLTFVYTYASALPNHTPQLSRVPALALLLGGQFAITAAFPLFDRLLFDNLKNHVGPSVLSGISACLFPIVLLCYYLSPQF